MGISLSKGQKLDLTKGNANLSHLMIGLGWTAGDFDLDTAAFMLGANGKVSSDEDFIFYGNLKHASGAVEHKGDNLTGGSGGDAEQIKVDLSRMPQNVERVAFTATIYDADTRKQNFGQVKNAYIRVVDEDRQQEEQHGTHRSSHRRRHQLSASEVHQSHECHITETDD
ncbi:MAG: TerD family protein, partial [Selenomonadaceae bacterium]|nr:TerD family protein [Selenomonadaceae bacterium]